MSAHPDDEALSWAGDEPIEAELVDAPAEAEAELVIIEEPLPEKPQTPAYLLVAYGVIAGAFLLYAVGWGIAVSRSTIIPIDLLSVVMASIGNALAVASPAIWFGAVIALTRADRPLRRLLWLVLGLALLVPWPFVLGV